MGKMQITKDEYNTVIMSSVSVLTNYFAKEKEELSKSIIAYILILMLQKHGYLPNEIKK